MPGMGHVVKDFGRVVPAVLLDATQRAQAIVADAEARAQALLAAAQHEAEILREAARRSGQEEGRAAAEAAFTTLAVEARADAERIRAGALPAARTLAVRMAEKIVGHTVDLQPALLAELAARVLAAARARAGVLRLRVHPDDLAALEAARPALVARLAKEVTLRLVSDAAVGRYGCVVESPAGQFDARLETQLAALERAVFGVAAEVPPLPPLAEDNVIASRARRDV